MVEAKQAIYDYLLRLPSADIPLLPSLRSRATWADRPPRIVGVTLVANATVCSSPQLLASHVLGLLAHCQAVVLAAGSRCEAAAAVAAQSPDVFVASLSGGEPLSSSLSLLLGAADSLNGTHVLSLGVDETLSADFAAAAVLQQLILGLDPGETLLAWSDSGNGRHVPIALALGCSSPLTTDYERASFGLPADGLAYFLGPGTGLPGYPVYKVSRRV
jgi:hypothetical protein